MFTSLGGGSRLRMACGQNWVLKRYFELVGRKMVRYFTGNQKCINLKLIEIDTPSHWL